MICWKYYWSRFLVSKIHKLKIFNILKCQIYDQLGHTAKHCPQFNSCNVTVNCASTSQAKDTKWLNDSIASHNITDDLAKLYVHSEYDGTDEVVISDGSGLRV